MTCRDRSRSFLVFTRVANWQEYTQPGSRMGIDSAVVTIVNFSDFQCPFCRRLSQALRELRQKYPQDVSLIYRHYPLSAIHSSAAAAALASECAGEEGAFEAYHDLLYSVQDSLGLVSWTSLATRAGLADTVAFAACVRSDKQKPRIDTDMAAAERLGIRGTPMLLVNDIRVSGAPSTAELDSLIQLQLGRNKTRTRD